MLWIVPEAEEDVDMGGLFDFWEQNKNMYKLNFSTLIYHIYNDQSVLDFTYCVFYSSSESSSLDSSFYSLVGYILEAGLAIIVISCLYSRSK